MNGIFLVFVWNEFEIYWLGMFIEFVDGSGWGCGVDYVYIWVCLNICGGDYWVILIEVIGWWIFGMSII